MKHGALVLAGGCLLIAARAEAADFYVDAALGDDANPGTPMAPFATIGQGLVAAMPGDTVIVKDGTYNEAPISQRDGADGMPITIRAENSRGAKITASGNVLTIRHAHHVVEGLVIDGQLGAGRTVRLREASSHVILRDLEVHHSGNNCIEIAASDDVLIEKSSIHHCLRWANGAPADAHGITGDAPTNLTVSECEIFYVSGDAIQISPPRLFWDNLLVERTVMWTGPLPAAEGEFQQGGIYGENAFDSKTPPDGPRPRAVFRDVIAYGWKGFITNQAAFNVKENVDFTLDRATISTSEIAFRMRGPALAKVQNAVTYQNDKAVRYEDAIADLTFHNVTFADPITDGGGGAPVNMVFQNALFFAPQVPAEAAADPSNLAADVAFFVDSSAGDFHLVQTSPAVNAGIPLVDVLVDRDGVARPVGAAYDVGAYEWTDMPVGTGGGGQGGASGGSGSGATGGGGPGGSASGGGGEGGSGGSSGNEQSGGCGCRTAPSPGERSAFFLGVALATMALSRRRRKS